MFLYIENDLSTSTDVIGANLRDSISLTSYFDVNVGVDPHNSLQIFFITSKPWFFDVI